LDVHEDQIGQVCCSRSNPGFTVLSLDDFEIGIVPVPVEFGEAGIEK
jgi:hypothetical protein